MAEPQRLSPLAGMAGCATPAGQIGIKPLDPSRLWLLRAEEPIAAKAAATLGLEAPAMLRRVNDHRAWMARLGPDEYWLGGEGNDIEPALRNAMENEFFALVDIGHRIAGIEISGGTATTLIAGACPLDLHTSVTPPGTATRTVFGKAEIILSVLSADRYRLRTNRSFSRYLWALANELGREHGLAPA